MAKTLDDCLNCPKCNSVGKQTHSERTDRGSKAHVINCQNEACLWFETGWVVEVKSDGTVVERDTSSNRAKQFPKLTDNQKSFAQRQIDEAKNY